MSTLSEEKIMERFEDLEKLIFKAYISNKRALTLKEAAIYTGRSLSNLYKLTALKQIPHSKPEGKMVYFDRLELDNWMLLNPVELCKTTN